MHISCSTLFLVVKLLLSIAYCSSNALPTSSTIFSLGSQKVLEELNNQNFNLRISDSNISRRGILSERNEFSQSPTTSKKSYSLPQTSQTQQQSRTTKSSSGRQPNQRHSPIKKPRKKYIIDPEKLRARTRQATETFLQRTTKAQRQAWGASSKQPAHIKHGGPGSRDPQKRPSRAQNQVVGGLGGLTRHVNRLKKTLAHLGRSQINYQKPASPSNSFPRTSPQDPATDRIFPESLPRSNSGKLLVSQHKIGGDRVFQGTFEKTHSGRLIVNRHQNAPSSPSEPVPQKASLGHGSSKRGPKYYLTHLPRSLERAETILSRYHSRFLELETRQHLSSHTQQRSHSPLQQNILPRTKWRSVLPRHLPVKSLQSRSEWAKNIDSRVAVVVQGPRVGGPRMDSPNTSPSRPQRHRTSIRRDIKRARSTVGREERLAQLRKAGKKGYQTMRKNTTAEERLTWFKKGGYKATATKYAKSTPEQRSAWVRKSWQTRQLRRQQQQQERQRHQQQQRLDDLRSQQIQKQSLESHLPLTLQHLPDPEAQHSRYKSSIRNRKRVKVASGNPLGPIHQRLEPRMLLSKRKPSNYNIEQSRSSAQSHLAFQRRQDNESLFHYQGHNKYSSIHRRSPTQKRPSSHTRQQQYGSPLQGRKRHKFPGSSFSPTQQLLDSAGTPQRERIKTPMARSHPPTRSRSPSPRQQVSHSQKQVDTPPLSKRQRPPRRAPRHYAIDPEVARQRSSKGRQALFQNTTVDQQRAWSQKGGRVGGPKLAQWWKAQTYEARSARAHKAAQKSVQKRHERFMQQPWPPYLRPPGPRNTMQRTDPRMQVPQSPPQTSKQPPSRSQWSPRPGQPALVPYHLISRPIQRPPVAKQGLSQSSKQPAGSKGPVFVPTSGLNDISDEDTPLGKSAERERKRRKS